LILLCIKESGKRRLSKLENQNVLMESKKHTAKNVVVVHSVHMEEEDHHVKNVVEVLSVHMEG
jgi:hypothetical protein